MYWLQVDRSRCGSRPYLLNVSNETSEGGGIVLDGALKHFAFDLNRKGIPKARFV